MSVKRIYGRWIRENGRKKRRGQEERGDGSREICLSDKGVTQTHVPPANLITWFSFQFMQFHHRSYLEPYASVSTVRLIIFKAILLEVSSQCTTNVNRSGIINTRTFFLSYWRSVHLCYVVSSTHLFISFIRFIRLANYEYTHHSFLQRNPSCI